MLGLGRHGSYHGLEKCVDNEKLGMRNQRDHSIWVLNYPTCPAKNLDCSVWIVGLGVRVLEVFRLQDSILTLSWVRTQD
jgi:hypothetical protein